MKGMYETYVKVDYARSWIERETMDAALEYLKGELTTMMPKNVCSASNDFIEDWGESYIDFIGFTGKRFTLEDFNVMTDRLVLDNCQDAVDGLEITVLIHNDGLIAQYQYENDTWEDVAIGQKRRK